METAYGYVVIIVAVAFLSVALMNLVVFFEKKRFL